MLNMRQQWSLGANIAHARRCAGRISQATLGAKVAEILGVEPISLYVVGRWERDVKEPTVSEFRAIAEATEQPWLLELLVGNTDTTGLADGMHLAGQMALPFALNLAA